MFDRLKEKLPVFNFFKRREKSSPITHLILFLITFVTCTIAGTQWAFKDYSEIYNWGYGIQYAFLILGFLSAHEFGHYFAAKFHKVSATLPYYIPFPIPGAINFGTFGAVIKTLNPIPSRKALFDIGAAGPLAGFVVALSFLIYGFVTLPGIDFIYSIHPEYIIKFGGLIPTNDLHFGDNILYWTLAKIFASKDAWVPPMNEMYHYPFLNVGWFGLFVTSLNMLPFGQLDGGHITYAMFGKFQSKIAKYAWIVLISIGLISLLGLFREILMDEYTSLWANNIKNSILPTLNKINTDAPFLFKFWPGWLFWALLSKYFVKLPHPDVEDMEYIGPLRMVLGWIAIIILIVSFSYNGIYII